MFVLSFSLSLSVSLLSVCLFLFVSVSVSLSFSLSLSYETDSATQREADFLVVFVRNKWNFTRMLAALQKVLPKGKEVRSCLLLLAAAL